MRLVFASNNAHKLEEVRKILPPTYSVVSLNELGYFDEIDETGTTLEENSLIKANCIWQWLAEQGRQNDIDGVIADDTGLEVDALGGEPGVYSARWAMLDRKGIPQGEQCTPGSNRAKMLRLMEGKTDRAARFRTVITLIRHGETLQMEGEVKGWIAAEEKGEAGFGYDSLFVPEGYELTFAQLGEDIKNSCSHRARALKKLKEIL